MSPRTIIEKIWDAAVSLYRSGVHPAVQLCLRRDGEVVLDRAIGIGVAHVPGGQLLQRGGQDPDLHEPGAERCDGHGVP